MNDLGSRLRQQRMALGMSQVQLCTHAGVSLATVQKFESGRANPTLSTLKRILSALGMDIQLKRVEPSWDHLAWLGMPVTGGPGSSGQRPTPRALHRNMLLAAAHLEVDDHDESKEREREALQALLLALRVHFPSRYMQWVPRSPVLRSIAEQEPSGRVLKLSRLARQRLAEYL